MKQYKDFTLQEWLFFLENRHANEIQLGLARVKKVALELELLKQNAKVITVAGTNGKGSTVTFLEQIYIEAGYKVGCYTSPHLLVFNERIRINQKQISDQLLCQAFTAIEQARGDTLLTYFEVTTLAALLLFKHHVLDIVILEVGLGGRLDATNIIDADLAIITTIDLDHQALLGSTKEAIGFEKAGILRKNRPVIFADVNPPSSIIDAALQLNAPLYILNEAYRYKIQDNIFTVEFQNNCLSIPMPHLHPQAVAGAIIGSILLSQERSVTVSHLTQAAKKVFIPARLQVFYGKINVICDVAHNSQSVERLASFIKSFPQKKAVHAVFSAFKDKDISGLLAPLVYEVSNWFLAKLNHKRAASESELREALDAYGKNSFCYESPLLAYEAACKQAKRGDLIVIYGSFITVSNVITVVNNSLKLS